MNEYLESLGIRDGEKYISEFRGALFVIKCGGSLVENRETGDAILDDIAFLSRAGIRPALVHGGSVQADREMEREGICPRHHRGLRITCDKTIKVLERCFGNLNTEIVRRLIERGAGAVGFSGRSCALVRAEKMTLEDGVDLGWVGDVTDIARDVWDNVGDREIPVIASLGLDADGNTLNINADYVATRLALLVGAKKLILMTDVAGVLLDPGDPATLIPTLTAGRARALIADGTIARGMIPKIESAVRAIESGLPVIHLINGRAPHSLILEIFTDEGVGTQIIEG